MRTSRAAKLLTLAVLTAVGLWYWAHLSARTATPEVSIQADKPIAESARLETAPSDLAAREQVGAEHAPPNQVRIRVTNFTTHEPIAGANVEILSLEEEPNDKPLVTTADGTVAVSADSLVGARVRVHADGYCPVSQLVAGSKAEPMEIELCVAGTIRVRVLDERQAPAAAALVVGSLPVNGVPERLRASLSAAWPNHYGMPGTESGPSVTDESGVRVLDRMPCGVPLRVTASRTIPETSVEVAIDPGSRHAEVEIVATSKRCIHGRLVWEDGTPVQWVSWEASGEPTRVYCLDRTNSPNGQAQAQAERNGEFLLCDLQAGRVNWRVDWPGEPARSTVVDTALVEVGDIVLHKAVPCAGRVYLTDPPKDFSYSGIFLLFHQNGREVQRVGPVQADGGFHTRLPVGSIQVEVTVTNRDRLGSVVREVPSSDLAICLDPFVGRLRITNLDLDPRISPFLRLEDRREEARSKWGAGRVAHEYFLLGTESIIRWSERDLCAWFLSPGTYDVYVGERNDSTLVCAGRAVIAAGEEFVLDASKNARGKIHGLVKTPAGAPVGGTNVVACPSALLESRKFKPLVAASNEHGEFEFSQVGAGRWSIFPSSRGSETPEAQTVEVAPGSELQVSLTMDVPGRIGGTVRRHGKPADGSLVVIRADTNLFCVHRSDAYKQRVAEDGMFKFGDLAPGRYELRVYSGEMQTPDFRSTSSFAVVEAGKSSTCDIDLDFALTPLNITREGEPLEPMIEGCVAGPGGYHALERMSDPRCWGAEPMAGPCVFLFVQNESFWEQNWQSAPKSYLVAYEPRGVVAARKLRVDVHGGKLVVRPRTSDTVLPWASLESVGEFKDLSQLYAFPLALASVEDGTSRTFSCIPAGSTVLLESDRALNGPVLTKRVNIGSQSQVEVLWPPE